MMIFKYLGFSPHWCQLIYNYFSIASFFIILNSVPYDKILLSRGIRQREHPFILASEGLIRLLKLVESTGHITGICLAKRTPSISHFIFVDDLLIFSKINITDLENLMGTLKKYVISEQVINLQKSNCHLSSHLYGRIYSALFYNY